MGQKKVPNRTIKQRALKEAISDTLLASLINFPMNYILIGFCFWMNMSALEMTVFMTAVFSVTAIIRKYYVRLYFSRGDINGKT